MSGPGPMHQHHHHPAPAPHHDHASAMADPAMATTIEADMRRRFWVALAFTLPVLLIAGHVPGVPMLVHAAAGELARARAVHACGLVVPAGSSSPGAISRSASRKLDMSVLIATGVLAAYLSSLYLTRDRLADGLLRGRRDAGHLRALRTLDGDARPGGGPRTRCARCSTWSRRRRGCCGTARRWSVPTAEVVVGDLLRLRPGDKIPVDGALLGGNNRCR